MHKQLEWLINARGDEQINTCLIDFHIYVSLAFV